MVGVRVREPGSRAPRDVRGPSGGRGRQGASGPAARLTHVTNAYAAWSPDGTRIVTRRVVNGNSEVFVMDADGRNARNLTGLDAYDGWPVWSPDGRRIAYASGPASGAGRFRIMLMDADGGNKAAAMELPAGEFQHDRHRFFSPDGTRLSFTRYREGARESADICVMGVP